MRYFRGLLSNLIIIALLYALLNPGAIPQPLQQGFFNAQNWLIERLPENIVFPSYSASNVPIQTTSAEAAYAAGQINPAVVTVMGTQGSRAGFAEITTGTGFIVHTDGYIITNKHVVAEPNARYRIVLPNKKIKTATVVYRHPSTDIAILKISGSGYTTVKLGDSSTLKIRQPVLAIGNSPIRKDNRLSVGEISALRRSIFAMNSNDERLRNVIQTSAKLYQGDSGGPLFNLNGEVIGINTATAAVYENVSFSIPINDAQQAIDQIIPSP